MPHELADLRVTDRVGRLGHFAGEDQRHPLRARQLAVVLAQGQDAPFVHARAPQVGDGLRLAVGAVVGVSGGPAHHPAQLRLQRVLCSLQKIKLEHGSRRARQGCGQRTRPGWQRLARPFLQRWQLAPRLRVVQEGKAVRRLETRLILVEQEHDQ